jgi:hypothetical protein
VRLSFGMLFFMHHSRRSSTTKIQASTPVLVALVALILSLAVPRRADASTEVNSVAEPLGVAIGPGGEDLNVSSLGSKADAVLTGSAETGLLTPLADPAPAVVTTAASLVTQTSATLNATVNPEGAEVSECKFEYGTTTAYGTSQPCSTPPGSGTSPVAVSASVTGLSANTTYDFRIVAKNVGGRNEGSDETFTTLSVPAPTVTTPPKTEAVSPPSAIPASLPAPVLAHSFNIASVAGRVLVRLPGAHSFVTLSTARQVPYRTIVEATDGEVVITAATPKGGTQKGWFLDGQFMLTQGSGGRVLATLTGGDFSVCPPRARAATAELAKTTSRRASSTHIVRKLWAYTSGNFSMRGNYAAGIVQNAQWWLTEDMCEGTLILATRNHVEVTDLVRHRNIAVLAGDVYIAKPR